MKNYFLVPIHPNSVLGKVISKIDSKLKFKSKAWNKQCLKFLEAEIKKLRKE